MSHDIDSIGKGPKQEVPSEFSSSDALMKYFEACHQRFFKELPAEQIRPMLIAVCENGDVVPVITQFDGEESKQGFCETMRESFRLWKVVRYGFFSEAWIAGYSKTDDIRVQPSQRNDRKEVVMTTCVEKGKPPQSSCLEIVRDWSTGAVAKLLPDEQLANVSRGGRMATLLE